MPLIIALPCVQVAFWQHCSGYLSRSCSVTRLLVGQSSCWLNHLSFKWHCPADRPSHAPCLARAVNWPAPGGSLASGICWWQTNVPQTLKFFWGDAGCGRTRSAFICTCVFVPQDLRWCQVLGKTQVPKPCAPSLLQEPLKRLCQGKSCSLRVQDRTSFSSFPCCQ